MLPERSPRGLKYAHENGCPRSEWTCYAAAQGGHLECLKYARESGYPWDEWTCYAAAEKGHLECLKYLHEKTDALEVQTMRMQFFFMWVSVVSTIRDRRKKKARGKRERYIYI